MSHHTLSHHQLPEQLFSVQMPEGMRNCKRRFEMKTRAELNGEARADLDENKRSLLGMENGKSDG